MVKTQWGEERLEKASLMREQHWKYFLKVTEKAHSQHVGPQEQHIPSGDTGKLDKSGEKDMSGAAVIQSVAGSVSTE